MHSPGLGFARIVALNVLLVIVSFALNRTLDVPLSQMIEYRSGVHMFSEGNYLESIMLDHMIVELITDKKGEDTVLMDLSDVSLISDYFVIASANNERLLNAITENVRDEIKKQQQLYPLRIEGQGKDGWVLMDYGDVDVHLFSPE